MGDFFLKAKSLAVLHFHLGRKSVKIGASPVRMEWRERGRTKEKQKGAVLYENCSCNRQQQRNHPGSGKRDGSCGSANAVYDRWRNILRRYHTDTGAVLPEIKGQC